MATLFTTREWLYCIAPVYLAWLIPPLVGEKLVHGLSAEPRAVDCWSSPPLSAVCMFARESAKRSRPSSVLHRPETIYSRVEDRKKIECGRRTGGGKPRVTGGIQYYYRNTDCRSHLNVDNHACALLGLGVPAFP